jgi:creatinine amidohydrolase/Fe(II)-dependent formamide hydrolase-like protein
VTKPKSKSNANSDVDEAKTNGVKSKERKSSKEINKNGGVAAASVASVENGKPEVENGSKEIVQQPENGVEPEENGEAKTDVDLVSFC